jgi:hypothetical protein
VANHEDALACKTARLTGQTGPARQFGSAKVAAQAAGQHLSRVAARRRPLWRWLLVALLGVFSLGVTVVYIATVTIDVRQHHWAGALDASRAAVPAAVGWAALLIIFFGRSAAMPDQLPAADEHPVTERQEQAALARASVRQAEHRVQRLAASLTELSAVAAEDARNQQLARQIGDTAARLDLAMQWLIGARAALAASQSDLGKASGTQPSRLHEASPPAGRVALVAISPRRTEPACDRASMSGMAEPAGHESHAKDLLGGVCRGTRRDDIRVGLVQVV